MTNTKRVDISLSGCRKSFESGGTTTVALDGVDLAVHSGQVVAVVGSNGAGKSTLLAAIAGTLSLDSGKIKVRDDDIADWPSWKRFPIVGVVRQNPSDNVCAPLTVEENFALALGCRTSRWRSAVTREVREAAAGSLAAFGMGLEDRLKTPIHLLSGGQRQAVAVAMATARQPTVLLADEHTAALDPRSAEAVLGVTRQVADDHGITTLMVTHDMSRALQHADRLVLMHRGSVLLDVVDGELRAMTEADLVERFRLLARESLTDRVLLT